MTATLHYLNTGPCEGCGEPVDYLHHPWYPLYPDGQLCHRCGHARGLTGIMPAAQLTPTPSANPLNDTDKEIHQ
jgi:hypothetical protein